MDNKGNDKQQHADSVLHNTKSHTQHLYQISKSLAQQFREIFDKNFPMYYTGVRWKKGQMEKK